jgi:ferritin
MSQLSSATLALLNSQYGHEKRNQLIYESMASAMDFVGLTGSASFLRKQADGESQHAKAVYDYINLRNQKAIAVIVDFPESPSDFFMVFNSVKHVESDTTDKLLRIGNQAFNEGDLQTFFWASELIKEQSEEENVIQTILDRIATCGTDQCQIQLYDNWIGQL